MCHSGGVAHHLEEASMADVSTIGLDIAKAVFHAHGADASGRLVFSRRLTRAKLLEFFNCVGFHADTPQRYVLQQPLLLQSPKGIGERRGTHVELSGETPASDPLPWGKLSVHDHSPYGAVGLFTSG